MLITVAVPTHNRPQLLLEALASIAAHTYSEWHTFKFAIKVFFPFRKRSSLAQ